mgnify:CR=1 FL=1|jgi:ribosomal protein S18 acetylase RimI-like enzyme
MNIEVHRIKSTEAVKLRACRLAALEDSPHAFGVTLEDEKMKPISAFESDAFRLSSSDKSSMFLAHYSDQVYGQIGAFIDSSGDAYICAMWVSPLARNMKVGTRLANVANNWLVECGHNSIYAWVVDNNDVAISFYKRLGFIATKRTQMLPSEQTLSETLYVRKEYS